MTKLEEQLFNRASKLAGGLAEMHDTLFCLIADLRNTKLSPKQDALIAAAASRLHESQHKFLAEYAAKMGGGAPERN
jgi:hypothetical protein